MKQPRMVDLKAIAVTAMEKYGFNPQFPETVIQEVMALTDKVSGYDTGTAGDLRSLLWSSIDNSDSMDLDQLEYCERVSGGGVRVLVAVADVDIYVPRRCHADRYAAHNGTSIYTGIVTFPMLPDRLSKDISSLLPDRDRLAIVVEYTVLPDGDLRPGVVSRALVRNKAKLVYEELGDWLEGTGPIPAPVRDIPGLRDQIQLQAETARRLRKRRMDMGALDLQTIEAQPVVEGDRVQKLVVLKQNMARIVIEEFMVAANRTMVSFLGDAGVPMIQRVVKVPKYWDEIILTAAEYGVRLPKTPDVRALASFLRKQKEADPERFPDLSLTIIKLLGPGEYMPLEPGAPPTGHFSMAVTDYTHGTAPNRRYVDVINQRLIKSVLDKTPGPYTLDSLVDHAIWLTDREKGSKKVERFMRKAAAAVLLQDQIGSMFEALVTGSSEKGTYVRLIEPPAEGRVVRGERGLWVGQKVRVRLLKTDPYNGFIDFERIGGKIRK
ncbi:MULTISPECIES: RNB domain-containing ribonuclease [unclassified Methanoregula]|uniref:RNB domain-containing ribonuclease n=1 Tax=unclassified Methanoregula TaxID=2649730 RepID=UPI0009CA20E9|nr:MULTISPECIES: RNB domain-containing ribonuclease [unclassified Methanoregula]OPX62000.1 MAG: exoribonuclease R [Methanoregula sp. PtaB.Bin085]OPY34325.1 MAG: exoribonuclease R [Methanoregula sp. PtaU1.Bin006]